MTSAIFPTATHPLAFRRHAVGITPHLSYISPLILVYHNLHKVNYAL